MTEPGARTIRSPRRTGLTFMRIAGLTLLVLLVAALFLLGRTGLVPGLSKVVGADRPRDLGVRPTEQEFAAVLKRIGFTLQNQPAATLPGSFRKSYQGKMEVDQALTESELSALLTFNHVSWWPLSDVQLKVHEDGTIEASLSLVTRNIPWEQVPAGILSQLPDKLPEQVPIYLKGRLEPVGPSRFTTEIERLEVGRLALPASILSQENQRHFTNFINDRAAGINGFTVESLQYAEGRLHFKGTFPESFTRVAVKP